jgi:hypothetical protein
MLISERDDWELGTHGIEYELVLRFPKLCRQTPT